MRRPPPASARAKGAEERVASGNPLGKEHSRVTVRRAFDRAPRDAEVPGELHACLEIDPRAPILAEDDIISVRSWVRR